MTTTQRAGGGVIPALADPKLRATLILHYILEGVANTAEGIAELRTAFEEGILTRSDLTGNEPQELSTIFRALDTPESLAFVEKYLTPPAGN